MSASRTKTKDALITELREQLRAASSPAICHDPTLLSTGAAPLDRLLPEGGLRRGMLVEWLSAGRGSGAALLALIAAREASREGGAVVVCDRAREFFPPAAWGLGIAARQLVVVRPRSLADEQWVVEQCLRSTGVAATWSYLPQAAPASLRRWQLAAETGGGLGFLIRPASARGAPTWSDVQLLVTPRARRQEGVSGRRLCVEVLRCRGGPAGQRVELEIEETTGLIRAAERGTERNIESDRHETNPLPASAELAPRPAGRRSAGA